MLRLGGRSGRGVLQGCRRAATAAYDRSIRHSSALPGVLGMPLWKVAAAVRTGEMSAQQVTAACLERLEATQRLGAFTFEGGEDTYAALRAHARDRARELDLSLSEAGFKSKRAAGDQAPPLSIAGIPIALKANYCTAPPLMPAASPTNAGSRLLKGLRTPYSATVAERLYCAGAVLMGKTAMDEFAMGSTTSHSVEPPCINPYSTEETGPLSAGGSSGGSAVAVASGAVFAAMGSDTGGSVRQPAAWTGIVGFKPSYGRLSRHGLIAFASSLDCPAIFTRHVTDSALLLDAMSGEDSRDVTTMRGRPEPVFPTLPVGTRKNPLSFKEHIASARVRRAKRLRVGIPREYWVEELSNEMVEKWKDTAAVMEAAGAEIVPCDMPNTRHALPTYLIIANAEASSNLARYDGVRYGNRVEESSGDEPLTIEEVMTATRDHGFGAEVKRRILLGTFALAKDSYDEFFVKAQQLRTLIKEDFDACFRDVDVLLTPTAPSAACPLSSVTEASDPVQEYLNDVMTTGPSLAGVPAVSLPQPNLCNGLPVGMQLIAARGNDDLLLQSANVLEHLWKMQSA